MRVLTTESCEGKDILVIRFKSTSSDLSEKTVNAEAIAVVGGFSTRISASKGACMNLRLIAITMASLLFTGVVVAQSDRATITGNRQRSQRRGRSRRRGHSG